ncbi:MAG TPA: beta-ketoacyl-ACP synthase III [Spirochaetia bacterium]|nr:beta-ketoacyl-ACP synthase III [Spirochaetia bacterium]
MKAVIRSVGSYLPERVVTNDDLARTIDTSDEWIFSHTGIKRRRIAADSEATSDLAYEAAKSALERAAIPASEIDLIIVATATPDYNGFPSTACIVQERLGASGAGAMDMAAACTGFIYGIETASNYIRAGAARNILVIGSETLSRVIDWNDRNTCVLFGDGAGAVLLSAEEGDRGVRRSLLRSDGSGAEHLWIPGGGSRAPIRDASDPATIRMNGRQVYNFAVRVIGETIDFLLGEEIDLAEIAYIVPHQANVRIMSAAAKRLEIPVEKFYMNIQEYANTSAASIPIALDEMATGGHLKAGDLIVTVGFGGGLTYGGNLIRW